MSLKIYNTLSKKIEEFIPVDQNEVKMYTCGPTVYSFAHIGNLRTYIFEDVLEKTLKYIGYNVKRVMNITDVGHIVSDADDGEDKMMVAVKKEGKSVNEIADFYTEAFLADMDKLNIKRPEIIDKATDNINNYIEIISNLLQKNIAYIANQNVYFDTAKFSEYYKLSGRIKENNLIGVREDVEEDINKRNPEDFALWMVNSKFSNQEQKWNSPWGVGYPGWHIECSGIAIKYFGEKLDIHCGGVDNIFPHHENEIAQSESYLGHKWCNYWIHGEFLNDETGKMSKSKGEFLTISLLESKGYDPLSYRYLCLQSHYQNQLVFSFATINQAKTAYAKLKAKIKNIYDEKYLNTLLDEKYLNDFTNAITDNLNTSNALTVLYAVLKDNDLSNAAKTALINNFDQILSLDLLKFNDQVVTDSKNEYILNKIEARKQAKLNKDFATADLIRKELEDQGIILKDTKDGTIFEIMNN